MAKAKLWEQERDFSVVARIRKRVETAAPEAIALPDLQNLFFKPKTPGQQVFADLIEHRIITFCTGPAGSGKSFVPCGIASRLLKEGAFQKLILTRPLVTCGFGGRALGPVPGGADEKVAPYMRPLLDTLATFWKPEDLSKLFAAKKIEVIPMELMRGMSIRGAFILCDEAQNAELAQLHMLLTRFGEGSKMVISGDANQTDLRAREQVNPLLYMMDRLTGHDDIGMAVLTEADILRHPLIRWIEGRLRGSASHSTRYLKSEM